jgi:hypothetical protein
MNKMKYLQNFKENKSNEIDLEYIDMCFVDFIDEDRYKSTLYRGNDGVSISIGIPDEYSIPYSTGNIDDLITVVKWKEEEYLKVKDALNRIKLQIPNLMYYISFDDHENLESPAYMNIRLNYNKSYYHTI